MDKLTKIKYLIEKGYTCDVEKGIVYNAEGKELISKNHNNKKIILVADFKATITQDDFIIYMATNEVYDRARVIHLDGDNSNSSISNLRFQNPQLKYQYPDLSISEKELLKMIRKNLNMQPGFKTYRDKNTRNTIINNSFIKIINKINQGKITTNLNDIKGYMFILCKNEFNAERKRYNREQKILDKNYDITESEFLIPVKEENDDLNNIFELILRDLKLKDDTLYQHLLITLDGGNVNRVMSELNIGKNQANNLRRRLYTYINKNYKKIFKEYNFLK